MAPKGYVFPYVYTPNLVVITIRMGSPVIDYLDHDLFDLFDLSGGA